ncbi:hypothetical protein PR048_031508 [Dryococelus australis]|uniref:Uncharacterized protein n=1 Tax=Dryococelus australis TaxID=614101 RepID=A0ABQ9G5H6_9NEOP|nr:hypothetical protein PR048_031508 [Dryococelus australis]
MQKSWDNRRIVQQQRGHQATDRQRKVSGGQDPRECRLKNSDEQLGNKMRKFWEAQYQPPRSSDLNPLDLYLLGHLKALVYATPEDDVGTLRNRIEAGCETIRNCPGIHQHIRVSMQRRPTEVRVKSQYEVPTSKGFPTSRIKNDELKYSGAWRRRRGRDGSSLEQMSTGSETDFLVPSWRHHGSRDILTIELGHSAVTKWSLRCAEKLPALRRITQSRVPLLAGVSVRLFGAQLELDFPVDFLMAHRTDRTVKSDLEDRSSLDFSEHSHWKINTRFLATSERISIELSAGFLITLSNEELLMALLARASVRTAALLLCYLAAEVELRSAPVSRQAAESKKPYTLEEITSGAFSARGFNGTWISAKAMMTSEKTDNQERDALAATLHAIAAFQYIASPNRVTSRYFEESLCTPTIRDGEPYSVSGYSLVGNVSDIVVSREVFSGWFRFSHHRITSLHLVHLASPPFRETSIEATQLVLITKRRCFTVFLSRSCQPITTELQKKKRQFSGCQQEMAVTSSGKRNGWLNSRLSDDENDPFFWRSFWVIKTLPALTCMLMYTPLSTPSYTFVVMVQIADSSTEYHPASH